MKLRNTLFGLLLLSHFNLYAKTLPESFYQKHPYHFKFCAETRYQMKNFEQPGKDFLGLPSGHAIFYINGVKKVSSPNPIHPSWKKEHIERIKLKEISRGSSKKGVGFSIDAIYKAPPFIMIDSWEELAYVPSIPDIFNAGNGYGDGQQEGEHHDELTPEIFSKLKEKLVADGYYDHLKVDRRAGELTSNERLFGAIPPYDMNHIPDHDELLYIADFSLGTDIAVAAARGRTYCLVIPLNKAMTEQLVQLINHEIDFPQGGYGARNGLSKKTNNVYDYSISDHCGVFPRNLLASLGIVWNQPRNISFIELPFYQMFPLDTLLEAHANLTGSSQLSKNIDKNLLLRYGENHHRDIELETIEMYQPNSLFIKNLEIHGVGNRFTNWFYGQQKIEKIFQ